MQLMNLVMSVLPYAGSGSVSRFGISLRLGILTRSPKLAETVLAAKVWGHYCEDASRLMAVAVYDIRRAGMTYPWSIRIKI